MNSWKEAQDEGKNIKKEGTENRPIAVVRNKDRYFQASV